MNDLSGNILTGTHRDPRLAQSHVLMAESGSRVVATFLPAGTERKDSRTSVVNAAEREAFKFALVDTLTGTMEGALSPYLFYDPPGHAEGKVDYKSAWGSENNIPYGAPAWDAHIQESTTDNPKRKQKNAYTFAEGDEAVIATALQQGLLQQFPRRMTFYSYGPGDLLAVRKKEFQILDAAAQCENTTIEAIYGVDINRRYARQFADAANTRYDRLSQGILGDFMEGTLNDLGNKIGTSVVGIFGGPFANAPSMAGTFNSKQKAAQYLAQLVSQHGEGTRVINTFDVQMDEAKLLDDYKPTRTFEAFILGAFPRAVNEGIIKNQNYDIFANWKLKTAFNAEERAVKLIATAKKSHTILIENGPNDDIEIDIKEKDERVFTLSHKWNEDDWSDIYNAAGLDDPKFYSNNSRRLAISRVSERGPDLSLLK